MDKVKLLEKFREKADEYATVINNTGKDYKGKAGAINKEIMGYASKRIEKVLEKGLPYAEQLDSILLINYVCYVVMLEYRNMFWPYEYMAFARRIGEIWEPFCKTPFYYPVKELRLYNPPSFGEIQKALQDKINNLVSSIDIPEKAKKELLQYYNEVWMLIDSGNVNLGLDLHFEQDGIFYDVDYKSGFSSNEKGNTNRLLLVGSIYESLPDIHKNLIFVRQPEEENNHYLKTLKKSPYWQVFCADEAYNAIAHFTGFDLKKWMIENMDWVNDISPQFREFLNRNALLKYLTW
ncbi:hypothetical protein LY28_02795 [Ruminiclostridium sufflavum DSM 19573]|uniref:Uncharacterized protein n=1 Tax=Ruminiclostridium sufflavum DSM 19573 TaxID=1121337 RepID=A0A318XM84_9FIRM|nr:hypothetical protein [Ruminiclostridium sufflavum]PYG86769.1 hypothetical protein LY28_02795 [Ruminiclostridium sufflavum DSM 19573]